MGDLTFQNPQKQAEFDWQGMAIASIDAICVSMFAHMREEKVLLTPEQLARVEKIGNQLREVADEVRTTFPHLTNS